MFSLRIVNVDHYMSVPKPGLDLTYSQFRGSPIKSVPVCRIFGSTPSGNKTCLHVHGVFPYILVPYSGEDDAGKLMYKLAYSLDKAINVSQNTSHSTRQHVFKIVQVSGRPFYGYHSQDHQFFKIFFYNPLIVKRACDLLQNGAVCGTKFQIHEGHVPFTLQFFIDYNLYGMSFINLKSVVYRKDGSPLGVTPGDLPKESSCELEADAVAVDILNRLTIEGELAVNPGLAAIWREEKQRLKRDALEVSQRPEPPLVMSERLLREKLEDNLKFQGKCKTPLKENIPYPLETQRTAGSDILDASMLDTHSVSSLVAARHSEAEATTVVDEELVLSLTQSSILSNSLDQSLLVALDNLAAQNEVNTVMSQGVEDDSILGSQILPEQDMFDNDISDGELAALNFSLPPDLASDGENDEESDENFEENIPQLDGVGDLDGKKKKSKQSKIKRRVLVENSASDTYPPSDAEELFNNIKDIKDNIYWPESGRQETLEEIFSDEEPYNSPINNFEDNCEPLDLDTINVDLTCSFETVLRGDPSFTSGELASEDVIFQPCDEDDDVEDTNEKESLSEEQCFKETENVDGKKTLVDKNSNLDAVPSLNNSLDTTDVEKSVMLAISGEELLNTSQLDEKLNEDLNKGLEIICEKSPQQEFEENWNMCGDTSETLEENVEDNDCLNDEVLASTVEFLCGIECPEERLDDDIIVESTGANEGDFESVQLLNNLSIQLVDVKPFISDLYFHDENIPKIDFESKEINTMPKKMSENKSKSPQKSPKKNICIKWPNKKNRPSFKYNNSSEMTRKEIETYYAQLESLTRYLATRTDTESPQPILWFPIRENMINLEKKIKRKSKVKVGENKVKQEHKIAAAGNKPKQKSKTTAANNRKKEKRKIIAVEKIMKNCKFSESEILKMRRCKVKVHKLTRKEIMQLSGKPSNQSCNLNENKTVDTNNSKQNNLKVEIHLQCVLKQKASLSSHVENLESKVCFKEKSVKQKKSSKHMGTGVKGSQCLKKSPKKLSNEVSLFQLEEKSSAPTNNNVKRSQYLENSSQKLSENVPEFQPHEEFSKCKNNNAQKFYSPQISLIKLSDKVPALQKMESTSTTKMSGSGDDQSITNGDLKNQQLAKTVEINERQQKNSKSVARRSSLVDIEENNHSVMKKKNVNCLSETEKVMKGGDMPSCGETQEVASPIDQSTSFKLNKKCVIELLPICIDKTSETHTNNPNVTKGVKRKVLSDHTSTKSKAAKKKRQSEVLIPEKSNDQKNINPLVKVELLVTSCTSSGGVVHSKKEIKRDVESKKQRSSNKVESNSLNNKSLESNGEKKRPLTIFSLDGTVDDSSSDENLSGRSTSHSSETKKCSTPNKRKNSKSCRSPRNYAPLSIEIKKSPNIKLKTVVEEPVKLEAVERITAEHRSEGGAKDVLGDSTSQDEPESSKCHVKRKFLNPVVSINRIPSKTNLQTGTSESNRIPSKTDLHTGTSDSATWHQPTSSTTSHPIVKRLKVCVKRMSLDAQGDLLEHERVAKLRNVFQRRSSLPITSE